MLQPEYDYDLFNHSGASSLFPTDDTSYDRSSSAPPPQGLQSIKLASGSSSSQQPTPSAYDPGQAWNLWKNETSSTDNGKYYYIKHLYKYIKYIYFLPNRYYSRSRKE